MSKTSISWTDETANWIVGCTKTRAKGAKESGCDFCYAATAANSARLQQFDQYKKVVDGKGNWNGHIEFVPKVLDGLLKGRRSRRVFAPSMSDPFHPNVKDEWLDQFMATVVATEHITYQLLTKRPERMMGYFKDLDLRRLIPLVQQANDKRGDLTHYRWKIPFPNLHLGVTVENQAAANDRIPLLLQTPAAVRFLSVEPMLEKIDLNECSVCEGSGEEWDSIADDYLGCQNCQADGFTDQLSDIDQVIIGGESGSKARPFHLEWARSLIDQCREAGVKVFMKQTGSNAFYEGKPFRTKSRAGTEPMEWPEWARIQEFPTQG